MCPYPTRYAPHEAAECCKCLVLAFTTFYVPKTSCECGFYLYILAICIPLFLEIEQKLRWRSLFGALGRILLGFGAQYHDIGLVYTSRPPPSRLTCPWGRLGVPLCCPWQPPAAMVRVTKVALEVTIWSSGSHFHRFEWEKQPHRNIICL